MSDASPAYKSRQAKRYETKTESLMKLIAFRCAYYRYNIHRFAKDYLGLRLKLFQQILLWAMARNDIFYFIAARSAGKTFLTAIYCVCMAILYPHIKIVAVSYTYKQGREIVKKITDELMPLSPMLRNEIESVKDGQNESVIKFKSGSTIRVCGAGESTRGARSNILIVDESRLISQKILDTVLRPLNGTSRQPGYLSKPEYQDMQEVNKEIYLSSAYYKQSEMYERFKGLVANMLNPAMKCFVCDLPYTLMIKEGLLMRQTVLNEMSEATFSPISFSMEREGVFYSSAEDSLFEYKLLEKRRTVTDALYDLEYYKYSNTKMPEKAKGEIRILAVDIALMASRRFHNDASALVIDRLMPTSDNNYINNFASISTAEGLVTEELGLTVMRTFYQYNCDYLVIDGRGVGQAIVDYCLQDRYDSMYGETYTAINCINNDDIAVRCKTKGAKKVMYVIQATSKLNNDMLVSLRAGFQNGNINLLVDETQAEIGLAKSIKGYWKLPEIQRDRLRMPYAQTTALINELINLEHEISGGFIKVKEKASIRKDRFSACEYCYWISQELARDLKPSIVDKTFVQKMIIRRAKYGGVTI